MPACTRAAAVMMDSLVLCACSIEYTISSVGVCCLCVCVCTAYVCACACITVCVSGNYGTTILLKADLAIATFWKVANLVFNGDTLIQGYFDLFSLAVRMRGLIAGVLCWPDECGTPYVCKACAVGRVFQLYSRSRVNMYRPVKTHFNHVIYVYLSWIYLLVGATVQ